MFPIQLSTPDLSTLFKLVKIIEAIKRDQFKPSEQEKAYNNRCFIPISKHEMTAGIDDKISDCSRPY